MHVRYSLARLAGDNGHFCAAVGQRGHLHPLGTGQRFADGAAGLSFSDCPGRAGAAGHRPSALATRAGHPPADSGHRPDADWRLFGLLLEAMANGVTPGLIATIMGIQPILTLCVVERRLQGRRLSGLLIALAGLVLLVWRSLAASPMAMVGDPVCAGGSAADDLWRAVAKAQPSGAGGCPAAASTPSVWGCAC